MRLHLSMMSTLRLAMLGVMLIAHRVHAQQQVMGEWQINFIDIQQRQTDAPTDVSVWTITLTENMTITIRPDKAIITSGSTRTAYDLVLQAKDNNSGDITLSKSDARAKVTLPGIYKFEGAKLAICFGLNGDRPKTFEIKSNQERALIGAEKK